MANYTVAQWQAGDVILDAYKVIGILGQSELGESYRVKHLGWATDCVVKSLRSGVIAALEDEAFEQNIAAWAKLGLHPHIVSCYSTRRFDGQVLLITEYVAGSTLQDWIDDRRLYSGGTERSLERILDIAIQVAWGLHNAHQQRINHENVQPERVLITPDGIAKLTDFGLLPSHQPDLWGWGVLVLQMFAGKRIGSTDQSPLQILEQYLKTELPLYLPAMPGSIAQLLRQYFQIQPNTIATLHQVAQELQHLYQQVVGYSYPRQEPSPSAETPDSLNNRAVVLWDEGQQEAAWHLWERVLVTQPQHIESIYNRGLILWRSGREDDLALLHQLTNGRTPDKDWQIAYLLSLVHLERGDFRSAQALLESMQQAGIQKEDVEAALVLTQELSAPARQLIPNPIPPSQVYAHPEITSLALSLGSRYALSTSATDPTVRLWDVATGRVICNFRGHKARVTAVAFSPNGNYILSASEDKTIKLAEVVTTSYLHTFKGHWGTVRTIASSRDGYSFLSGSDDKTLKLWDVTRGKCLRTLRGHRASVTAVAFSPDGRYAFSASEDKTLKQWELSSGRCLRTIEGLVNSIRSIAFSPDGRYLAVADHLPTLLDAATGAVVRSFQGHQLRAQSVGFSPNGQIAFSASEDGTLKLWDVATGRCLRTLEGHSLPIRDAALSPDGCYVLSADAQGMRLWTVNSSSFIYQAPLRLSQAESNSTRPSIDTIYRQSVAQAQADQAEGNLMGAVRNLRKARLQPGFNRATEAMQAWFDLYRLLPRQGLNQVWERGVFERHTGSVLAVAFSTHSQSALSGSADCTLKLWDVATGRCIRSFEGHREAVHAVALNADATYALSASQDRTLKLWAVATGSCLQTFRGHENLVTSVQFSPDGTYALSGSADHTLKLWQVATGRCLHTLTGHGDQVTAIAFSADGRYALSGSTDQTLKLWDVAQGEPVRSFMGQGSAVMSVALSPDGRYALSGSLKGSIKLWDVATGNNVATWEGHQAAVHSVHFNPDGQWAVSASADGTVRLWEVAPGNCLQIIEAHRTTVYAAVFSPDGQYLLSGSADKTCKLWVLDWELMERSFADWDERARPYLENFLVLNTPVMGSMPFNREPTAAEITHALTRRGVPSWTEADLLSLLQTLSNAGFGWLRPEGVRQQLAVMARSAQAPEKPVSATAFATSFGTAFETAFATSVVEPPTIKVLLTVTDGSLKGQKFEFADRTTCVIGRAKDCNLQLPNDEHHKTISRYHCLLDINPPAIRIRDLGSLHGTYVNGQIIGKRQPNQNPTEAAQAGFPEYDLQPGDEIKLGKTVFQVRVEGAVDGTSFGTATIDPGMIEPTGFVTGFVDRIGRKATEMSHRGELPHVEGYDLLRPLGLSEGMYLARSQQNDALVGLKVLMPHHAVRMPVIEAFLREVENIGALQHPHIVQLLDSGYADGWFFFAWEYCDRGSVAEWLQQQGRLTIDESVPLILQVLDGLEYAHNAEIPHLKLLDGSFSQGRGLVHRDLKPSNLLLQSQAPQRLKIADYGLTKAFDKAGLSGLASSNTAIEFFQFMPRQQAINFNYAKPEVDVWATAACFYYLLTGMAPRDFTSKDPYLVVLQNEPVPIRQRNPDIPKLLAELIDMALADNPDLCFKSAAAFKLALKSVI